MRLKKGFRIYSDTPSYDLSSEYCKSPVREENTAVTSVQQPQQQVQSSVSDACICVPHERVLIKLRCQHVQQYLSVKADLRAYWAAAEADKIVGVLLVEWVTAWPAGCRVRVAGLYKGTADIPGKPNYQREQISQRHKGCKKSRMGTKHQTWANSNTKINHVIKLTRRMSTDTWNGKQALPEGNMSLWFRGAQTNLDMCLKTWSELMWTDRPLLSLLTSSPSLWCSGQRQDFLFTFVAAS